MLDVFVHEKKKIYDFLIVSVEISPNHYASWNAVCQKKRGVGSTFDLCKVSQKLQSLSSLIA